MHKIFSKVDQIKNNWDIEGISPFLQINFLKCFVSSHPKIKHFFIKENSLRFYFQIIKLDFKRVSNYINYPFVKFFLACFRINVLYFSNTFLTNINSFFSTEKFNLEDIILKMNHAFSMVIVPETLKDSISSINYKKIEVEEDMVLNVKSNWNDFDDYLYSLRSKYRKKIKNILILGKDVRIDVLTSKDFKCYEIEIQKLFDQVIDSSKFNGPKFNVKALHSLINSGYIKVYGYFVNKELIAFSTEMEDDTVLYSYYVGFKKTFNNSHAIYGRILIETIRHAINQNKASLVLGRTANEFKSNFGAEPKKSFIYVRFTNIILNFLLSPFVKLARPSIWIQRHPFKANT